MSRPIKKLEEYIYHKEMAKKHTKLAEENKGSEDSNSSDTKKKNKKSSLTDVDDKSE